ncbi:MAG: radical SAM protein [Acutalibacteraceae bacterium]|nr:radical SAM protein [Acutalibacteraceae bacterium]
MDKIKRYVECYIPTETCNLRCHYCYIAQKRKFNNKLAKFEHSKEIIRKALSKERLGGTCLLNFCAGGETLLSGEVLPVVKELLQEGHYIMLVTNGTLDKRFQEIATWPLELLEHLVIKFSFHYLEFKRLNLLEKFFSNINLMKSVGVSFTVEVTPSDELVPYIDELKNVCIENLGTLCHVTIARDDRTKGIDVLSNYSFDKFKEIWGEFQSDLFNFKTTIFYKKRKEFCYAGDWSVYLNLNTGRLSQCYFGKELGNIYQDIESPINFEAVGYKCELPHCYNGHAFLTLGDIPELNTPTYAQVRNRVCSDGSEWLTPKMKSFMSSKLCESNKEYSTFYKNKIIAREKCLKIRRKLSSVKYRIINRGK